MKQLFSGILILFYLTGCGEGSSQKPYIMGKDQEHVSDNRTAKVSEAVTTENIRAEAQKEIARINKERDIEVQKLKSETDIAKAGLDKEVALKEVETKQVAIAKEETYVTYLMLILASALLLLFLFLFYYTHKNRRERLKKHEDEMMLKLRLQEQEMKMKMAEKILDSIASGKLSPEQEKHLIETLENTTTKIVDQKK